MGKPFRVIGPGAPSAGIGRLPDGRFYNPAPPSAERLERDAVSRGEPLEQVVRDSTPLRDWSGQIPWGPVQNPPLPYRAR